MAGHNFNNNTFTIIEQIKYGLLPKLRIHNLLEHRKDFWISKQYTLSRNKYIT